MSRSRSIPEELIKIKAQAIWKDYQNEGIQSTLESSRIEARQYLEKHRWEVFQWEVSQSLANRPIKRFADWWETTRIEEFVLEDIKYLLENSAFLSIVTLIAEITIILSLITWIAGRQERREDEIFATWQVVNDASEDQSGVVKIALERLLRNKFSLAELELKNTNLLGAKLQEANLYRANLQEASLYRVNLQEAYLDRANLQEAYLESANLQKAKLESANLQKAYLDRANLQEAYLERANLQEAYLERANLQEAYLSRANFQEAYLYRVNLQEAYLSRANFQEALLDGANLQEALLDGAENLTAKQIKSACFWEKAIYKGEWNYEKQIAVATEPDNTKFIEELKKDKSSDPIKQPDCSNWKK